MGFFSLKATCGVCGKSVGWNRFKVAKSKAWICPECLKKANMAMQAKNGQVVNVWSITIEELKDLCTDKEDIYHKATILMRAAGQSGGSAVTYRFAAIEFESIADYKDSASLAKKCREKEREAAEAEEIENILKQQKKD